MNRRIVLMLLVIAAVAASAVLWPHVAAFAQPKGEKVTVKGEVVDLWCFLEDGSRGPDHKECAIACAKAGNPIGIVDAKDNVYVVMGLKDHQPGKEVLLNKMAETVSVDGILVKKGGVQVIYVSSVK